MPITPRSSPRAAPAPWSVADALRLAALLPAGWRRWRERHRQRYALSELDDRLLADVGLTRREAERECRKPPWR